MLNTDSVLLKGNESFEEAYAVIPERDSARITDLYYLDKGEYKPAGSYTLSLDGGQTWSSARQYKEGQYGKMDLNSKHKLQNTKNLYEVFTKATHAGSDSTTSWLVGNIDGCNILGDDYNIQGLIISTIFDPMPRYYISFERIVCKNQFSQLGKNSCSMYIDMNKMLRIENKESLTTMIQLEAEKRIESATRVYDKLARVHLTEDQIKKMFQMLTIDKVAKNNTEKYHVAELEYEKYWSVYSLDDNQNYRKSLFGFVNACTNIQTRKCTNPLQVIKPVLPASVIDSPCNFDYLCRAAVLQNI